MLATRPHPQPHALKLYRVHIVKMYYGCLPTSETLHLIFTPNIFPISTHTQKKYHFNLILLWLNWSQIPKLSQILNIGIIVAKYNIQVSCSHTNFVAFESIPRRGIIGSYLQSIFSIFQKFHRNCTNMHSHWQHLRATICLCLLVTVVIDLLR